VRKGYLLLLLLVIAPAQAAVYQWKDENGRVHFSDRPVGDNASEKKLKSTPTPSAKPAMPEERKQRRQRMLDTYEKERAEKREAKAEREKERKEQKRKCHAARARYDEYNTAGSIYDYLESGERKYLNKEERKRFIANLKADVARYCK
jgi:hypothetical protein